MRARMALMRWSRGGLCPARERQKTALRAWLWVEAAPVSCTARDDRNASRSARPMVGGGRVLWKKLARVSPATDACAVRHA